jgi:hypothetical protein
MEVMIMNKLISKLLPTRLKDDQGMALLMVISSIAILTFLLADFTFETKINKIKSYNYQDKHQARLTAEAGLNFAMAKLRLYQETRNRLEKNEQLKEAIQPGLLEGILIQPFIYPIPIPPGANLIQRTALNEFKENTILKGQLNLSIQRVSGFLNPNNLRLPPPKEGESEDDRDEGPDDQDDEKKVKPQEYIENKLRETLQKSIDDKKESDETFDQLYGELDVNLLIKELKFVVNSADSLEDAEIPEIESLYRDKDVLPKHGPMTSLDELYLLQGWPDAIIDLLKDRLTVHEVAIIALNELTSDQLKILFPKVDKEQEEAFFRHRDGDDELGDKPQPFKSEKDFKDLILRLGISAEEGYNERIKEFETAGLKLDVAGKLYKIVSTGVYGRGQYKITAYVDLPIKPVPEEKKKPKKPNPSKPEDDPLDPDNKNGNDNGNTEPKDEKEEEKKKPPLELMKPRIVEIKIG